MGLEEKYPDILQNIEFGIVKVYQDDDTLRDLDVIKALDALTSHYQRRAMGRDTEETGLSEKPALIFSVVRKILENRRTASEESADRPPRRRFSRAFREPTQDEIFLACLRKIEKSAKRWNKERGEQGYLDFVSDYIV